MLVLVDDLATIDPVLQHRVERTARRRLATPTAATRANPCFAADAGRGERLLQQPYRAQRGVAAEDVLHGLDLFRHDDQLVVTALVAERRHTAHPHALLLRGGDLVADALPRDLTLELRE